MVWIKTLMLLFKSLLPLALLLMQWGCATTPRLAVLPEPILLSPPGLPETEDLSTVLVVPQGVTDVDHLADELVSMQKDFVLPLGSRVVISTPAWEAVEPVPAATLGLDPQRLIYFQTARFFNEGEQALEHVLLKRGVDVVSRDRLEAALRAQRWPDDRPEGVELDPNGLVELVDTAEVIRAAEGLADYILQIHTLLVEPAGDATVSLGDFEAITQISRSNFGFRRALNQVVDGLNVVLPGYQAQMNAQLIDVKTGKVVWLGRHAVHTHQVLEGGFKIRLAAFRHVANEDDVLRAVSDHNEQTMRLWGDAEAARDAVLLIYKEYGPLSGMRHEAVSHYEATLDDYVSQLQIEVAQVVPRWQYAFEILPPTFDPPLPSVAGLYRLEQAVEQSDEDIALGNALRALYEENRKLDDHGFQLVRTVCQELLGTLPVE